MFSVEVKNRLSLAFVSTMEIISVCRSLVAQSSIPSLKREEVLGDLEDITNIMRQGKHEDIDAIEESIIALNEQGSFLCIRLLSSDASRQSICIRQAFNQDFV